MALVLSGSTLDFREDGAQGCQTGLRAPNSPLPSSLPPLSPLSPSLPLSISPSLYLSLSLSLYLSDAPRYLYPTLPQVPGRGCLALHPGTSC